MVPLLASIAVFMTTFTVAVLSGRPGYIAGISVYLFAMALMSFKSVRDRYSPPKYPRISLRLHEWVIVAVQAMMSAAGLAQMYGLLSSDWLMVWLALGLVLPAAGYLFFRGRAVAAARRCGGQLCLYCHYDMSALEQPGRCPECGKPFEAQEARAAWARIGAHC